MTTILAVLVFGAAAAVAVDAIFATVAPELARIGDLLRHGPVADRVEATVRPARNAARAVTIRADWAQQPLRAAA